MRSASGADFLIAPQDEGVDCAIYFNAVGFDRDLFRCRRHVRRAAGRARVGRSSERMSTFCAVTGEQCRPTHTALHLDVGIERGRETLW